MHKTLSQTQIIRSLGQALEWFEKEVSWGVSPAELNHLTGRIGELYAAMVTRGQMALATNQHGYDIVSLEGEYVSVKTITSSNHVKFNASTFEIVQRVMILRLIVEDGTVSIEEVKNYSADYVREQFPARNGSHTIPVKPSLSDNGADHPSAGRKRLPIENIQKLKETGSATHRMHRIIQYENGTVLVETNGQVEDLAKPTLREIARELGVDILNNAGNMKNTRSLGADIITALSQN